MKVEWRSTDMEVWDQAHAAAAGPLQQDWAYGSTMVSLGARVLRARVVADGVSVAQAQFIVRQYSPWLSFAWCTRGPLWLQPLTAHEKAQAYRLLRRTMPLGRLRLVVVTPDEPLTDGLGLPRIRRVMSGYSTVLLDISQPLDVLRTHLDCLWQQALVNAENAGLNVQRMGTNPGQYRWLLDAEMQQRAERNIDGMPMVWFERYAESRKQVSRNMLSFRTDIGRERLAGMLFLIHGQAATYQIGWTTPTGRETNAHHLMLWRGIEELQQRGVRLLDLGGVNTQRSAGMARFKIATGGAVLQLAGSYLL